MSDPSPPWTARTGTTPAPDLASYGECVDEDADLVEADLAGSIAHGLGLLDAGLLTPGEAEQLVQGLQTLAESHAKGTLRLDPALEDVHMNVEHELGQIVGPLAGKLHTARSRNDQVALDLILWTRVRLVELARATAELAEALLERAGEHAATPWPLHTHGLPGQPATLGYLLHAHAVRLRRDVADALTLLHAHDESPLGSGAGAGTTLDVDPATSAELLGLQPPENGLLATSARDSSIHAAQLAAQIGRHVGDLAVDLLDLVEDGAVELDAAYTTGSSIMPHKANPDALELARADAHRLASLADQAERVAGGLGLGYHRDLQRAKGPLLDALTLAPQSVGVATSIVETLGVDEDVLSDEQRADGVAATDAVEALVHHGVAFRRAHRLVSQACQQAGQGPIHGALAEILAAAEGIDAAAAQDALDALAADPGRREGPGGPAPSVLAEAVQAAREDLVALGEDLEETAAGVAEPFALLEKAPSTLVEATAEGEGSP